MASPIIAAAYALAGGAHGVPYPALTLYGHPGATYDVAAGGNGWCGGEGAAQCSCSNALLCTDPNPNLNGWGIVDCAWDGSGNVTAGNRACDAQAGYDGPTGWGTPNGLTAFTRTGPKVTIAGPTAIPNGTSGTWTASVKDPFPGGSPVSYTWNWGDGSANLVTTTGSASHTYTAGGMTPTITLVVRDNYGVTGSRTYLVTVS
jgi:hypothetical protein